jgi:hypothetical protein
MTLTAEVRGTIPYAGPDGPQPTVPQGPCEVEPQGGTVTLSWMQGESAATAVISREEFDRHVASGAITLMP